MLCIFLDWLKNTECIEVPSVLYRIITEFSVFTEE